jgi:hypothetical protein
MLFKTIGYPRDGYPVLSGKMAFGVAHESYATTRHPEITRK